MSDQQLAARLAAMENTLGVLLDVLRDKGTLTTSDVKTIMRSADDRVRHGIRVTPPDADNISSAVASIIRRAQNDIGRLTTR